MVSRDLAPLNTPFPNALTASHCISMSVALRSGQGLAGKESCNTLQTLLLLSSPHPQFLAQCYLETGGTGEPDRAQMDQLQHSLQAPSCEECQHHRSLPTQSGAEPAPYGLGQEARPSVERWGGPLSRPEPVTGRVGGGHVTSLNKVHIFHVHWDSQQAANLGVYLY